MFMKKNIFLNIIAVLLLLLIAQSVFAHGMSEAEKQTILQGGNLQYLRLGQPTCLPATTTFYLSLGLSFF